MNEQTVLELLAGRLDGQALSQVEHHVATCSHCAALLAVAASRSGKSSGSAATTAGERSAPAPSLGPGTTVGRFVVLGFLGAGGMGEVYAAYDPSLDRKVAIKFLRPELMGRGHDVAAERLRREARLVAKLSHPNVVVVYEIGVHGDRVFIAMEHVDGQSVAEWFREAPRSAAEILRVFTAAGTGLAAAHAAGVVHRDFKPQNVMLTRSGEVRVMDFGLAQQDGDVEPADREASPAPPAAGEGAAAAETRLTRTGALLGTPAYMAPEQLRGERATARTDQYSFCVALYEALYGKRPPGSVYPVAAKAADGGGRAAPPRSVPAWVRRILQRGLAAAPDDRYPSMDALVADMRRDRSRRRWLVAAAAAVLVVAGAWGAARARTARAALLCREGAARAQAVWPFREAAEGRVAAGPPRAVWEAFQRTGDPGAAETFGRVQRILSTYLSEWSARYTETCEATHVRAKQSPELLELRTACLDERLAAARALTDTLARADAPVVAHAADAALNLPDLDRCSELVLLRAAVKPPDGAAKRAEVEQLRRRMGALKLLAGTGHYESVAAQTKTLERDIRAAQYPPLLVDFLLLLHSDLWARAGVPNASSDIVREALAVAERSGYEEGVATALVDVVGVDYRNTVVADFATQQAEAVLHHLNDPAVLRGWLETNISVTMYARGRLEEGYRHGLRSVALKEQRTPRDGRDVAGSETDLCIFLQALGRPGEALPRCARAVQLCAADLGQAHPQTMNALENEASALAALGRFDRACPQAERVLAFFHGIGAATAARGPLALTLGRCALARNRPEAARDHLQPALTEAVRAGATTLEVAELEWQLARATWEGGQPARALRLAESAAARYATMPELGFRAAEVRSWRASRRGGAP